MSDRPHITVATVVQREERFLLVRERSAGELVYNQPAGHVESGESLLEAAQRETLEESGWEVEISEFLGIYEFQSPANGISYIRHCFTAKPLIQRHAGPIDSDIEDIHWLLPEEIRHLQDQLRSPMVWRAVQDFQLGQRYPLTVIANERI